MNAAYWPVPYGLLSLVSYSTQDHLPRDSTAHSEMGPPTSLINQENVPQACSQVNLLEAFSQRRFPFPTQF